MENITPEVHKEMKNIFTTAIMFVFFFLNLGTIIADYDIGICFYFRGLWDEMKWFNPTPINYLADLSCFHGHTTCLRNFMVV